MRTILKICIILSFFTQLSRAQSFYYGQFNLKNDTDFELKSDNHNIKVIPGKKNLKFTDPGEHVIQFKQCKKGQYEMNSAGAIINATETRKHLTFSNELQFIFDRKSTKKLVLKDDSGKTVLKAKLKFQYPVAQFNIDVYEEKYLKELVAYASYYLIDRSKRIKSAFDSPYMHYIY